MQIHIYYLLFMCVWTCQGKFYELSEGDSCIDGDLVGTCRQHQDCAGDPWFLGIRKSLKFCSFQSPNPIVCCTIQGTFNPNNRLYTQRIPIQPFREAFEISNSNASQSYSIELIQRYNLGYSQGYGHGYNHAFSHGSNQGFSQGFSQGSSLGYSQGTSHGYGQGYGHGYSQGYSYGSNQGFNQGYSLGSNQGTSQGGGFGSSFGGGSSVGFPGTTVGQKADQKCDEYLDTLPYDIDIRGGGFSGSINQQGFIGGGGSGAQQGSFGGYRRPINQQGYSGAYDVPTAQQGYHYNRPNIPQGYFSNRPYIQQDNSDYRPDNQQGYIYNRPNIHQGYLYNRPDIRQGYTYNRPTIAASIGGQLAEKYEYPHMIASLDNRDFSVNNPSSIQQNIRPGAGASFGGVPAGENEYPHMALLGYGPNLESAQYLCGGSVISDKFILTAGHCVGNAMVPVRYIAVGILKRSDPPELWQRYSISRIIPHPQYNFPSKYNDIALLEMSQPIQFSQSVLPACLYTGKGNDSRAIATGWGAQGPQGRLADNLEAVVVKKFADQVCLQRFPPNVSRTLSDGYDPVSQLCYGDMADVKDTCFGDSGGPLQITSPKSSHIRLILGVTSFGDTCGRPGNAGVYTKVLNYVPWIEGIVWP